METTYTEAYKEATENMERSLKSYEKEMERTLMRGIFCDYLPKPTNACNVKPLPFSVVTTNLASKQL